MVLIVLIPNFLAVKKIEIIPVVYMKPIDIQIRKLPPLPPSKPEGAKNKKRPPAPKQESSEFIKKKIQSISLGKGLFLPPPAIQLPAKEILNEDNKIEEMYQSDTKSQKRIGRYPLSLGAPILLPDAKLTEGLTSPKGQEDFMESLVREVKKELRAETKKNAKTKKSGKTLIRQVSNVRLGVEGPISERRVLYRPPLPIISSEQSVQIRLKFWVAPNGVVDQIIPLERGGTKLESIAIQFLKKWKFEPLPLDIKQERQWGILTVKFVVK